MNFLFQTTFRALRHRNYRLFFFGQLVSLMGTWMQQTALSWLIYKLTGSEFLLGLVTAMGSLPMAVLPIWGGSLADRYSKRSILLMTQTLMMISAFLLAALVGMNWINIWWIIALSALNGIGTGFDMPTRHSFVVEMTNEEDLINAISLNSTIFNASRMVGPMLAGLVMAHTKIEACFFLNALSFLAIIVSLLMMRLPARESVENNGSTWNHLTEGFQYVWKHSEVLMICILFALCGIFGLSYIVIMPVIATQVLHVGEKGFGMLMSASGIGACLGALVAASIGQKFKPRSVTLSGVWIFSLALIFFSLSRHFYLSLIYMIIEGFGMILFMSTGNSMIQMIVSNKMRGRVMGIWTAIFGATIPLGSFEVGTLSSWIGAPNALIIGASICLASVIFVGSFNRIRA